MGIHDGTDRTIKVCFAASAAVLLLRLIDGSVRSIFSEVRFIK